jgi:hypothetical protein
LLSFVLLPAGHENAVQIRHFASVPYFIFVSSFYLNYSFLIPKFLFARRLVIYVIINLAVFLILSFLLEFWRNYAIIKFGAFIPHAPKPHIPYFGIFQGIIGLIFVNGLAVAVRSTSVWLHSKSRISELELENTRSELSLLKMQISPHFLFNTLNNILTLIDENSELAKQSVVQLSKLLRSVLYDSEAVSVTIEKETEFLTNYSNLMRLRYGSELNFNLETDLSEPDAPIVPLLLIPLLENIFKHGIGASVKDSFISIKISSKNGKIIFESSNTYFPKTSQDKSGSGIGIANTQKRLDLLYKNRYSYNCKIAGDNYITKLELQYDTMY